MFSKKKGVKMEFTLKTTNIEELKNKLSQRALRARRLSRFVFGTIILALVLGGFFFVVASKLAEKEKESYENIFSPWKDKLRVLETEYVNLEGARLEILSEAKAALERIKVGTEGLSEVEIIEELSKNWTAAYEASNDNQKYYLNKAVRELREVAGPKDAEISETYVKLEKSLKVNIAKREALTREFKEFEPSKERKEDESNRTTFLISTNVTRFGALAIIFLFVRILLSIYRFNVRLAAFYESRADALFLSSEEDVLDVACFEKIVNCLAPSREINISEISSADIPEMTKALESFSKQQNT